MAVNGVKHIQSTQPNNYLQNASLEDSMFPFHTFPDHEMIQKWLCKRWKNTSGLKVSDFAQSFSFWNALLTKSSQSQGGQLVLEWPMTILELMVAGRRWLQKCKHLRIDGSKLLEFHFVRGQKVLFKALANEDSKKRSNLLWTWICINEIRELPYNLELNWFKLWNLGASRCPWKNLGHWRRLCL